MDILKMEMEMEDSQCQASANSDVIYSSQVCTMMAIHDIDDDKIMFGHVVISEGSRSSQRQECAPDYTQNRTMDIVLELFRSFKFICHGDHTVSEDFGKSNLLKQSVKLPHFRIRNDDALRSDTFSHNHDLQLEILKGFVLYWHNALRSFRSMHAYIVEVALSFQWFSWDYFGLVVDHLPQLRPSK
ncbi:hypothetical protein Tco_0881438 [Tanacetum coccineum]